jgi:hypothetical protein
MILFYLVPTELSATGGANPKYFAYRGDPNPPALVSVLFASRYYGSLPTMLIAADVTVAEDALLVAQPDITPLGSNLDVQLGANLASVQNALEALSIPGSLLTATTTYRQVVRGLIGIFDVASCMKGDFGIDIFTANVTLATPLSALSANARQALSQCAAQLGYSQTGITLASTIRDVLVKISQQPPTGGRGVMLGVEV